MSEATSRGGGVSISYISALGSLLRSLPSLVASLLDPPHLLVPGERGVVIQEFVKEIVGVGWLEEVKDSD